MLDWGWIVVPFEVLPSRYAYLVLRLDQPYITWHYKTFSDETNAKLTLALDCSCITIHSHYVMLPNIALNLVLRKVVC